MQTLNYIRVILVEPSHPGNIGAVARSMANFGLENLILVNPRQFPDADAYSRAAGANWILDNAQICETVEQAISDCILVLGTTARLRSVNWPQLDVQQAMQKAAYIANDHPVAILFGRESKGINNEELDLCHYLVRIPVVEVFSSLNLGSAVTVMLYELHKGVMSNVVDDIADEVVVKHQQQLASVDEYQQFYQHLEQVLEDIEFVDCRSNQLMRKIKRLFNRAEMTAHEVSMLRGILTAINKKNRLHLDSG